MGENKNFVGGDAIAKIQELANDKIAMLCTFTKDRAMETRPMGTQKVDDDGTIYFLSQKDSADNQQIIANPAIQLIYADPSKNAYMTLEGTASVSRDQKKIDELWTPMAKAWFPEGKDDPRLTVITVTVSGGRYWDSKHGKVLQMAMIAVGALTGKPLDDGIHGTLRV